MLLLSAAKPSAHIGAEPSRAAARGCLWPVGVSASMLEAAPRAEQEPGGADRGII